MVPDRGEHVSPLQGWSGRTTFRQTLSDVSAHIGDVAWGFPDRGAVDALRMCLLAFTRFLMPTCHAMAGDAGLQAGMSITNSLYPF